MKQTTNSIKHSAQIHHLLICKNRSMVQSHQSPLKLVESCFPKVQSAKLNTDETILVAGREYFGQTAVQPRNHIPVNTMRKSHNHTFAALIILSTTTHNLLTFNISEISSNNSEKLSLLPDKHLWTFLLHSSYSSSRMYSHTVGGDHRSLVFTPERENRLHKNP